MESSIYQYNSIPDFAKIKNSVKLLNFLQNEIKRGSKTIHFYYGRNMMNKKMRWSSKPYEISSFENIEAYKILNVFAFKFNLNIIIYNDTYRNIDNLPLNFIIIKV